MPARCRRLSVCAWLTLAAIGAFASAGGPSHAGNDFGAEARSNFEEARRDREEQRRQREEARRQRDEERAARSEARRQREEERAARAEAKRQREEQRAQQRAAREEARREREAEKAARQAERQESRRQREAERAMREENRRERSADTVRAQARDEEPSLPASEAPVARAIAPAERWRATIDSGSSRDQPAVAVTQSAGQTQSEGSRGSNRTGERRESERGERNTPGKSHTSETSKSSGPGGGSGKPEKLGKADKGNERSEEKDDGKAPDGVEVTEDEVVPEIVEVEPPRTLSDMFKKWTEPETGKPAVGIQSEGAANSGSDKSINGVGEGYSSKPTPAASVAKPDSGKQPEKKAEAAGNGSEKKTSTAQSAKPAPQKQQPQTAGTEVRARGVDWELLSMGSFRRHEIIASGVDDKAAERLGTLGFSTISQVRAPGASTAVRRLKVPAKMSEKQAQAMLEQEVPGAQFGPNHVYAIVPAKIVPASDTAKPSAANKLDEPIGVSEPCAKDHCFPRRLMNWQDTLNSCASRVRIGLIDTSFDESHPAFAGRSRFVARDFRPSRKSPKNDWHGTAVLSVLAGSLDSAAPGLVPAADFYLASTFGADKDGQAVADAMSVLQALAWFDETRVDIVNMSFSGPRNDQIERAINAMAVKGVVFVAAAGNRGPGGAASYPAAYPEVIAVTAVNKDKRSYRYANHGVYVDVAAPGVDIFTALPGGAHGYRTGTSFATPFVTGLIAAMPEARRDASSKTDVLARITISDLGEPGRDPVYGAGLPVAPQTCREVGGVASLPWTQEAQRLAARKNPREPVFIPASVGTLMSFSP